MSTNDAQSRTAVPMTTNMALAILRELLGLPHWYAEHGLKTLHIGIKLLGRLDGVQVPQREDKETNEEHIARVDRWAVGRYLIELSSTEREVASICVNHAVKAGIIRPTRHVAALFELLGLVKE